MKQPELLLLPSSWQKKPQPPPETERNRLTFG
jgi:hypothetical protein